MLSLNFLRTRDLAYDANSEQCLGNVHALPLFRRFRRVSYTHETSKFRNGMNPKAVTSRFVLPMTLQRALITDSETYVGTADHSATAVGNAATWSS